MENHTSKDIGFADKLYQLISGNLSDEEETVLLAQIEKDPQLKKWFDEVRKRESLEKKYDDYQSIDVNKKWMEYSRRLKNNSAKRRLFAMRIAASILLVVSLSIIVYLLQFQPFAEEQIVQDTTFKPGTQRATLRVAGEMEYDLSDVQNIETERIQNNDGKRLAYKSANSNKLKKIKPKLHTVWTPRGGEYKLTLEDGTKVWLNADSKVHFQVPFADSVREVFVEKGEIYFEVSKNGKPFIVNSAKAKVRVLGTAFNFRNYEDETFTSTTLVEGQVEFQPISNGNEEVYILKPGYMAELNETSATVVIDEVDIQQVTAWKDGWFYFENKTVENIIHELSRWYDFAYEIENQSIANKQFTMKVKRFKELNTILEIIGRTESLTFKTEGNKITVK